MSTRDEQWKTLWKAEKTTCTEYTGHRAIMDWAEYGEGQTDRRKAAWHWLDDRISELAAGKHKDENTSARKAYMQAVLDGYSEYHWTVPSYPRDKATDRESVMLKERTYYCSFFGEGKQDPQTDPPYDAQHDRKRANYDWLKDRRAWILDCVHGKVDGQPPGWDQKARRQRYDNLNIALHDGDQWDQWKAGKYKPRDEPDAGGDWRDQVAKWHDSHLGITESPPNSNCDSRDDGIRHAQDTCANGTWLRNQPWCGVWAFMGLHAAKLATSGTHSWMASVSSIEDYAKQGKAPFRGWTTDGSKAKKGDLVVLFGRGVHVGTVREITSSTCRTWEGNTSGGSSGSQSNGGGSYKRDRSRSSETYGYALVREP